MTDRNTADLREALDRKNMQDNTKEITDKRLADYFREKAERTAKREGR